jgi:hypothetical protein
MNYDTRFMVLIITEKMSLFNVNINGWRVLELHIYAIPISSGSYHVNRALHKKKQI